jgi:hypothetical protein
VAVTESQFTQKLLKRMRQKFPSGWVVKHNDMRTAGVPDWSVSHDIVTCWFESKWVADASNPPRGTFTALQWSTLYKVNGWYVLGSPCGHGLLRVGDTWFNKGATPRVDTRLLNTEELLAAIAQLVIDAYQKKGLRRKR